MGRRSTRVWESLLILRIGTSRFPCLQIARQNLSFFRLQCVNFLFAGQGRASVPTRDYRAVETTAWLATGTFPYLPTEDGAYLFVWSGQTLHNLVAKSTKGCLFATIEPDTSSAHVIADSLNVARTVIYRWAVLMVRLASLISLVSDSIFCTLFRS